MESKKREHFLSLIIPVYKQEKTIVRNLADIINALDSIRYDYEIIIVIDGIIDNSLKNIKLAALPHVKTIAYKKNQGKSWALRLGLNAARGDYAMFIDAGMEIDPNGISMLLEHMEWYDADIVVGSKRHPASFVKYSLTRRVLSSGYYSFVKLLFGLKISDTQTGIKIFRKKVLKEILPLLVEKKFAGDLEMLVVARARGFNRIFEAPIRLDYSLSPVTSAANLHSIWGMLIDTLALFYRKNVLNYYEKKES